MKSLISTTGKEIVVSCAAKPEFPLIVSNNNTVRIPHACETSCVYPNSPQEYWKSGSWTLLPPPPPPPSLQALETAFQPPKLQHSLRQTAMGVFFFRPFAESQHCLQAENNHVSPWNNSRRPLLCQPRRLVWDASSFSRPISNHFRPAGTFQRGKHRGRGGAHTRNRRSTRLQEHGGGGGGGEGRSSKRINFQPRWGHCNGWCYWGWWLHHVLLGFPSRFSFRTGSGQKPLILWCSRNHPFIVFFRSFLLLLCHN